jgi:hypothetical protein
MRVRTPLSRNVARPSLAVRIDAGSAAVGRHSDNAIGMPAAADAAVARIWGGFGASLGRMGPAWGRIGSTVARARGAVPVRGECAPKPCMRPERQGCMGTGSFESNSGEARVRTVHCTIGVRSLAGRSAAKRYQPITSITRCAASTSLIPRSIAMPRSLL